MESNGIDAQPWPLRAAILALLGTLGGLAIHYLIDRASPGGRIDMYRFALATFIGVGLVAFGHGWVRGRLVRAVATGVVAGLVVALVFFWNGAPTDDWSGGENWRIVAALLAMFIFVPMAQGAGGEQAFRAPPHWSPPGFAAWVRENFDYATVHEHGWTNLIIAGLSVLFAGLFFLMLLLVGALFDLVHVSFLKLLLNKEPVIAAIFGGAIGASTGLLRDHRRIISALQGVAMTVLRMASPILAVALALFLLILPLTGLAPLWEATRSTTPILLMAVVVALILSNSVIGDGRDGEGRAFILRGAALILALVTVPLAVIAAISTGLRVGQYGWTPERLWAGAFVLVACIVAVSYLVAVVVTRRRWAEGLRSANLRLAFLICGIALLLSTPLVRFDAIATRDQMARLADGRTKPEKFDYRALWFEFGPAGKAAIRRLAARGGTEHIRKQARAVQGMASRWATDSAWDDRALDARLTILPVKVALPPELRKALTRYDVCGRDNACVVRYTPGADVAVATSQNGCKSCQPTIAILVREGRAWDRPGTVPSAIIVDPQLYSKRAAAVRAGRVEIRTENYRRVYIDGQPVEAPFPLENSAIVRTAP